MFITILIFTSILLTTSYIIADLQEEQIMKYKIKGKEVNIVFDGQYYIGTYGCIQIKRLFKIDVINYFIKKFDKQINSQFEYVVK